MKYIQEAGIIGDVGKKKYMIKCKEMSKKHLYNIIKC